MKLFQKIFGNQAPAKEMQEIEDLLSAVSGDEARYLACFALILARIADIDDEISDGERARIRALLAKYADLNPSYAELVSTMAFKTTVAKKVDMKVICSEINSTATKPKKLAIIKAALHVATDGGISDAEMAEIKSIAKLLKVPDNEFQEIADQFVGRSQAG